MMGWASGSRLLDEVAKVVMPRIPMDKRRKVAEQLIDLFEEEDCDTICECEQKDIEREYDRRYPSEEQE